MSALLRNGLSRMEHLLALRKGMPAARRPSNTADVRPDSIWDGLTLPNGGPVQAQFFGVSKAGSLSWTALVNNAKVKIYQVFNSEQAELIERVSTNPDLCDFFPRILHRQGHYVVAEWIDGKSLGRRDLAKRPQWIDRIAALQARLHEIAFGAAGLGFDYLAFLQERVRRYLGPFKPSRAISELLEGAQQPPNLGFRLTHLDVTPRNLIVEAGREGLRLVDNELLTHGPYHPLGLLNTCADDDLGHSDSLRQRYVDAYVDLGGDLELLLQHRRFFQAAWGLRVVGSILEAGNIPLALRAADKLSRTEHPVFASVEKKIGKR